VQSISGFADDLARMKELVDAISVASDEQARGIRHAGEGVDRMERLVHSTTATSEEIAASSEELAAQAKTSNDLVFDLHGTIVGLARTTAVTQPTSASVSDVAVPSRHREAA
jgi:methyl-accepting chemotaxis protein